MAKCKNCNYEESICGDDYIVKYANLSSFTVLPSRLVERIKTESTSERKKLVESL